MDNSLKNINNHNLDDDLDLEITEATEHFAQFNIRFRTPNRNHGPTHQQKLSKYERDAK